MHLRARANMRRPDRPDTPGETLYPSTPTSSLFRSPPSQSSTLSVGDGFTSAEVQSALEPPNEEIWQPQTEYADCEISDLIPGPRAVTFMGRVANIFDVPNTPKTPKSARGCLKLCVKDDSGAVTVRVWYSHRCPNVRLGSMVSVWTNHVSNGENGFLASSTAPLFASLFPGRDRACHLMIHESSDAGTMYRKPLDRRNNCPIEGLMTLQNFISGGHDVLNAKVLVVVKHIGQIKKVTRKDGSSTEKNTLHLHDETAALTLCLWGTVALSPGDGSQDTDLSQPSTSSPSRKPWKEGNTVLLLQAPGLRTGRAIELTLTNKTFVDVDPAMDGVSWLRRWASRQKSREAINPAFPDGVFDLDATMRGPLRCLYTIAELDDFARVAPAQTFQGFMSVLLMDVRLLEIWRRRMLFSGECCNIKMYANAADASCQQCECIKTLRLNPHILGSVVDETASISPGMLIFSDAAWRDLFGRLPEELLKLRTDEIEDLAQRLLFSRLTLVFGWTGDESKTGGRICVLGVLA